MRWLIGLGILAAGVAAAAFAVRRSRQLGQVDPYAATGEDDPFALPKDEPEYENGCLILGKHHPSYGDPYRLCLTSNQEKTLFADKRTKQRKLGCGVFACAYSSPSPSRVVKFTRDSEDVAALIKAQKTKLVPKVYAAYKLKQSGRTIPGRRSPWDPRPSEARDVPVYALVMERLRTIPDEERTPELDEKLYPITEVAKGRVTGNVYCDSRQDEEGNVGCDDIELAVVNAAEKLRAAGIEWVDIHSGNIGYDRRGKLKVLDLGLTKTELKRRLKILEGLAKPSKLPNLRSV